MNLRIYTEDLRIAKALIAHNEEVTIQYFYRQSYPLFKSIYDNYYTDCTSCREFINEIYVHVMTPDIHTGRCKLEAYRGESTLTNWLKTVCLYYCYRKFELKERSPIKVQLDQLSETDDPGAKHQNISYEYDELDISNVNHHDVMTILNMMPNRRYASLIRLRYLEQMSNEETAALLGMSLENYYNKHKLAKAQYEQVLRKEVRHG